MDLIHIFLKSKYRQDTFCKESLGKRYNQVCDFGKKNTSNKLLAEINKNETISHASPMLVVSLLIKSVIRFLSIDNIFIIIIPLPLLFGLFWSFVKSRGHDLIVFIGLLSMLCFVGTGLVIAIVEETLSRYTGPTFFLIFVASICYLASLKSGESI